MRKRTFLPAVLGLALLAGLAGVMRAEAEPPCRPLQPPRPICVPEPSPLPTVTVPPVPTIGPVPSVRPSVGPVPSVGPLPSALPTVQPVPSLTGSPTPAPSVWPAPTLSPLPWPTATAVPTPGPPPNVGGGTGWLPANAGIMWWQGANTIGVPPNQPPGEPAGAWWLTRRLVVSPHRTEVQHLGSFFHGAYVSLGGAAWQNLSPGCLLPLKSPVPELQSVYKVARDLAVAANGLDACGVEGLAYDPLLPTRVYASAYRVEDVSLSGATLGAGGVYVSDDLGVSWRKLYGGVRGNGLAVARAGTGPATIVAGSIQVHNGAVGPTPGGGSLVISTDDGRTWRTVSLPASGCADAVPTSQRITPTVAMRPSNPSVIYAGTNAGLYHSGDGGSSWSLMRQACGGIWGVALSPDGTTVYAGDHQGRVLKAAVGSTSFATLVDLGAGKVQDLQVDPFSPRTLYAAMWDGGGAGVYRIDAQSGGKAKVGGALLGPIDLSELPKPFPLDPQMRDGSMPSLFLGRAYGRLSVSTILRGVFVRSE